MEEGPSEPLLLAFLFKLSSIYGPNIFNAVCFKVVVTMLEFVNTFLSLTGNSFDRRSRFAVQIWIAP